MEDLIKVFRALSDSTRLRIMRLLLERALCVCELMFILKMEQSRISHQLRILRDADLVEDKREGKWITYRISAQARPILASLLKRLHKERLKESQEATRDLGNLEICLRQGVRRRHSLSDQRAGKKNLRSARSSRKSK